MTQFTNEFSEEVFNMTYRFQDETIDDLHNRVAKNLASVEKDPDKWEKEFKEILSNFQFIPGGRILSNAGLNLKGTSYLNCFVDGIIGKDQDSMEGILSALRRQALILKSEGGYGMCFDVIRPRGAFIEGIATESPGAVKMMEMWDKQSEVITIGSGKRSDNKKSKKKIRKGAMMGTMSCFSDSTEILTDRGWMNIVELIERIDKGEDINAIVKNGESKEIYHPIIREPEPIFEIETESGEKIQVTADHQFEVRHIKTNKIYLKKICEIDPELEELCIIETDN